jgi:hypothetical protein
LRQIQKALFHQLDEWGLFFVGLSSYQLLENIDLVGPYFRGDNNPAPSPFYELFPVLVVATIATKGVNFALAITVQTQTGCYVDQALVAPSFPFLVVATIASEGVNIALAITVQTKTGCYVDQALAPFYPSLVLATIAIKGVNPATVITVQTTTGCLVYISLACLCVHRQHHQAGGDKGGCLVN